MAVPFALVPLLNTEPVAPIAPVVPTELLPDGVPATPVAVAAVAPPPAVPPAPPAPPEPFAWDKPETPTINIAANLNLLIIDPPSILATLSYTETRQTLNR